MKIPKGGMYGAAVVSVIVALSIFLTVALNVETETHQVTKYEYVTDTTGLFDFDDSPEYYDFDLNKNYTGYYLESTDPYWGGASFTSTAGQVITDDTDPEDYRAGGSVNNYYVNLPPTDTYSGITDLTTLDLANVTQYLTVTFYGPSGVTSGAAVDRGNLIENRVVNCANISLSALIQELGLEGYDKVTIKPASDSSLSDRIVFGLTSDSVKRGVSDMRESAYTYYNTIQDYPTWGTSDTQSTIIAPLSIVADLTSETVDFYATTDMTVWIKTVDLDDVVILYSGSNSTTPSAFHPFGTDIDVYAEERMSTIYMDISKGVTISSTGS